MKVRTKLLREKAEEEKTLNLWQVRAILQAEVICGEHQLQQEVATICGADLMSDVLAFTKEKTLLLTGLTNVQVVRTAEVSGMVGIVFVRGKRPASDTVLLACIQGVPLMVTEYSMYEACGMLYQQGMKGCSLNNGC